VDFILATMALISLFNATGRELPGNKIDFNLQIKEVLSLKKHLFLGMMMVAALALAVTLAGCGGGGPNGPTGPTIYAGTEGGLAISTNNGESFTNYTTGLGDTNVYDIYVSGSTVYAATSGGLSISTDGGKTFTNYTSGMSSTTVYKVYVSGSKVYAATDGGLAISSDGGHTFTNYNAFGSVNDICVSGDTVYAATEGGGLKVSIDGGKTVDNTYKNGTYYAAVYLSNSTLYLVNEGDTKLYTAPVNDLSSPQSLSAAGDHIQGVYVSGSNIYAEKYNTYGLYISTDSGTTFTPYSSVFTTYNSINDMYISGSAIYVATNAGLVISSDDGKTFTNHTSGMANTSVNCVYVK
jgi:hypothetical protein